MGQSAGEPHELCGIKRVELGEHRLAELDAVRLAEPEAT